MAAAIAPFSCAMIDGDVSTQGEVVVNGVAGRSVMDGLRSAVQEAAGGAPVKWNVGSFTGPYCAALDTVRPISPHFGQAGSGLAVSLKGGAAALADTSSIVPRISVPNYASYLQVDYFAGDGSMVHLHPSAEERQLDIQPRDGQTHGQRTTMASASRSFPAGATITLGDPVTCRCRAEDVGWTVGPPFGTDMILAIASSAPLFTPPLGNDVGGDVYLARLQAAIASAVSRGDHISASVVRVDTVAR